MAFLTKGALMSWHFKSLYLSIILLGAVTVSSGCALLVGAAAGAGGFAYVKGVLQKNFDYPLDRLHCQLRRNGQTFLKDQIHPRG